MRRVIEPMLAGTALGEVPDDDRQYLVDLGLLRRVNGGGTLEREYAIGRGRMDLCLRYGAVTLGIELKVWRDGEPDPLNEGLEQLDGYLVGLGLDTGWLVIFDRSQAEHQRVYCVAQPVFRFADRSFVTARGR